MEANLHNNNQEAPVSNASNLGNMKQSDQIHVDVPNGSGSAQNIDGHDKIMSTPPVRHVDASTPTSSKKRGQLRVASLGPSPSARKGFSSPSSSFGAGLRNVPARITTEAKVSLCKSISEQDIREPLPSQQLPGITELLGGSTLTQSKEHSEGDNEPLATQPFFRVPIPAQFQKPRPNGQLRNGNHDVNDHHAVHGPFAVNPYKRRADELGLGHGITGAGYLGDILTPPGWQSGADPITEEEAERLFETSRAEARKTLEEDLDETKYSKLTDERKVARISKWETQHNLDKLVLKERVFVANAFQHWKRDVARLANAQRLSNAGSTTFNRPLSFQPRAQTAIHEYPGLQHAQFPRSPVTYTPSPPPSGGQLHYRLQQMARGVHLPQLSPMSPSFLDPLLVPQTLQAVYAYYDANQRLLMSLAAENEHYFKVWSAKFGQPPPQIPTLPGVIPPSTGIRAGPFASVQYGYTPKEQACCSPSQGTFPGPAELRGNFAQYPAGGQGIRAGRQLPGPSNLSQVQAASRSPGGRKRGGSSVAHARGRFKIRKSESPQPKKASSVNPERGPKSKAAIQQPRFHDEISMANLPTSVISREALDAGTNLGRKGMQTQTTGRPSLTQQDARHSVPRQPGPTHLRQSISKTSASSPPKARRGAKAMIDPARGFQISAQAANALISNGSFDISKHHHPGPGNPDSSFSGQLVNTTAAGPIQNLALAPMTSNKEVTAVHGLNFPAQPSPYVPTMRTGVRPPVAQEANARGSHDDSTLTDLNSRSNRTSSPDGPSDPKDTTYRQRKPATPRLAGAIRKASTGSKRRRSNASPFSAKKRTQHCRNGAAEQEG